MNMKMKKKLLSIYATIIFVAISLFSTQISYGQIIVNENFDYPVGSLITTQGWTA